MIDKFNFYDVYGYLLPGLALIAILWLPFGIVKDHWPASDLGSAILTAALAYLLGHLLQMMATTAIPSTAQKDSSGRDRFPSEVLLDPGGELSSEVKAGLAALAQRQFTLDLAVDREGDADVDKRRNEVFQLARQLLIREKATSYPEQFQGMYALTRGLVAALAIAFAYWAGWSASITRTSFWRGSVIFLGAAALLLLVNLAIEISFANNSRRQPRVQGAFACSGLIIFFATGYCLGLRADGNLTYSLELLFLAIVALLGSTRAYAAYKAYAMRFASTVWRDFLTRGVASSSEH